MKHYTLTAAGLWAGSGGPQSRIRSAGRTLYASSHVSHALTASTTTDYHTTYLFVFFDFVFCSIVPFLLVVFVTARRKRKNKTLNEGRMSCSRKTTGTSSLKEYFIFDPSALDNKGLLQLW
jgi:hypothetical protein